MTEIEIRNETIELKYFSGVDDVARGVFATRPVDPEFTEEIVVGVYADDSETMGFPAELEGVALQISIAGSARALDELGRFLIALARAESLDPDPHEHFEEIRDERGGNLHLIIRLRR